MTGWQVEREDLARWLVEHGLAEERPGYGHVDGERLAEVLLETFEMRWRDEVWREAE